MLLQSEPDAPYTVYGSTVLPEQGDQKMDIKFTREYEGGYGVRIDGAVVGYIERAMEGEGWTFEGRIFGRISEAKATIRYELGN